MSKDEDVGIAWVDNALCQWGRRVIRMETKAVGYPPFCPMLKDAPSSGVYGSSEPFGLCSSDFAAIDHAVRQLPFVLMAVVTTHYQFSKGKRDTAEKCGIHHKSVSQYLAQAHRLVAQSIEAYRIGA